MNQHYQLTAAASVYQTLRERLKSAEADIDDETLADTLEGLTDVHEMLAAVIRSVLIEEALAEGLKDHIGLLHARLTRMEERADTKRKLVRDVMAELDIKKLAAADFTVSLRAGQPGLVIVDENRIPAAYWEPRQPRLNRAGLIADLKRGVEITGTSLSNAEPVLSVRVR